MKMVERPVRFACDGCGLLGIVSEPASCIARGVLIVVGGPQYRAGSHRQFTLLARHLAGDGIASLRFDYRGMGDSEGDARDFERIEQDIESAIDAFFAAVPRLREVVVWGLCDAASAALFYGHRDRRVTGLVLLNPWIRTDAGGAKAQMKHYYLGRLFDAGLWRKIGKGRFDFRASAGDFLRNARASLRPRRDSLAKARSATGAPAFGALPLPDRMYEGFKRFQGRVLLVISGKDLTAAEFMDVAGASRRWRAALASPRVARAELPEANHTFARREWRDEVAALTSGWVRSW